MTSQWLVPFKGRNPSGPYNQNFLWRDRSVFVMDNHRAALWCWQQALDLNKKHSIFHIDRHTDTMQSQLQSWQQNLPPNWNIDIGAYLDLEYSNSFGKFPLFRWDNYLTVYFEVFSSSITQAYFATHDEGDKPNFNKVYRASIWELPQNLGFWLSEDDAPWIVNIDLDYFFFTQDDVGKRLVSDDFIKACAHTLKEKIDADVIKVITISLTPSDDLTGGWESTEKLATDLCAMLGVDFTLPA